MNAPEKDCKWLAKCSVSSSYHVLVPLEVQYWVGMGCATDLFHFVLVMTMGCTNISVVEPSDDIQLMVHRSVSIHAP